MTATDPDTVNKKPILVLKTRTDPQAFQRNADRIGMVAAMVCCFLTWYVLLCVFTCQLKQEEQKGFNITITNKVPSSIRLHIGDTATVTAEHLEEEVTARQHALSDEFIDEVNSKARLWWKAGRNFAEDTPMTYINKLMGVMRDGSSKLMEKMFRRQNPKLIGGTFLPTEFDARIKWPQCKSISEIRDQGGCGSCWAFGATETMTDRQCIHKNETFHYSAENLVSCCSTCGDGCDGGYPINAFIYWKTDGLVSGGAFGSHQGCYPYEVEPCEHHVNGNRSSCAADIATPTCKNKCNASYNSTFDKDLRFAKTVYSLSNEGEILRELIENGPVEASFDVYEDFLHYKSGVYHHVTGSLLGGHAIRVLGFGVEAGVPYYLCANSWNYDWGNGGFFKIRRDHMDKDMVAGIPA